MVCEARRLWQPNPRNAGVAGQVADLSNRGGSNSPEKTEKRGESRKRVQVWKQRQKKKGEGQEEARREEDEEGVEAVDSNCSDCGGYGGDGGRWWWSLVHVAGPAAT